MVRSASGFEITAKESGDPAFRVLTNGAELAILSIGKAQMGTSRMQRKVQKVTGR